MNINDQNTALLQAIRDTAPITALPLPNKDGTVSDFAALTEKTQLSPEQLAVADMTIQRIEASDILRNYMYVGKRSYEIVLHQPAPDWIKREGKDPADFADLMANLPGADPALLAELKRHTGYDLAGIQAHYQQWEGLREQETLKSEAIQLVQQAVDLRKALMGYLRLLGKATAEIDALRGR